MKTAIKKLFEEKKENESGYINIGIAFIKKQIIKNNKAKKKGIDGEIFFSLYFLLKRKYNEKNNCVIERYKN